MKKFVYVFFFFLFINRCEAIGVLRSVGGRSAAMGCTSVAERGLWAVHYNPAGMAYQQGWGFGLYYENRWLLRETAFKSGAVTKAFDGVGCLGLTVSQFGGNGYSESRFGLAYARDFGPYLQMGLLVDYLLLHWGSPYPNRGALDLCLGVQSQVTDKLRLGACLSNPFLAKLKTLNEDRIPTVLRFGLAYQITDDFVAQCELEKNSEETGLHLRSGFEYVVFRRVSLRAGAQVNPNLLSFGIGYEIWGIHFDLAAQMHQLLGASIQLGMETRLIR